MINHYFKFEKLQHIKAKTRYDLIAYTIPVYDGLNEEFIYLTSDTKRINAKEDKKPEYRLISKKGHISGIFIPDITKPNIAFGDIRGTKDLLILIIQENTIEIFVAIGKKNLENGIFNLVNDGELDGKMAELRKNAVSKYNTAA